MTKRPERNFFEQLRRNLPKYGYKLDLQRIENTASNGTPDVNYCIGGVEGWAELKAWERIRLTGRFTVPKLREEQGAWLTKRASVGGRAYLLCRINKDVALFDGRLVPHLFNKDLHADWVFGKALATVWLEHPVDWGELINALRAPIATDSEIEAKQCLFRARNKLLSEDL